MGYLKLTQVSLGAFLACASLGHLPAQEPLYVLPNNLPGQQHSSATDVAYPKSSSTDAKSKKPNSSIVTDGQSVAGMPLYALIKPPQQPAVDNFATPEPAIQPLDTAATGDLPVPPLPTGPSDALEQESIMEAKVTEPVPSVDAEPSASFNSAPTPVVDEPVSETQSGIADRPASLDSSETIRPFAGSEELTILSGGESPVAKGLGLGGKWFHLGLSVSSVFDDNIRLAGSGQSKDSDLLTFVGGSISTHFGDPDANLYITAGYTAGGTFVLSDSSQDSFDQSASLDLRWSFPKLTVGLHLRFEDITGGSSDAGDRVRRGIFYAGVTASYPLGEKFSLDVDSDVTYSGYRNLLDSTETRVQGFINYQAFPKISFGLGAQFGWLDVDSGGTQHYEQALARVTYEATAKLSFNANAGAEFRQFAGSEGDSTTPVFSVGAVYKPFERTTVSLDARRRIYGSAALEGQNYVSTGLVLSFRQQLTTSISASVAAGYEYSEYQASRRGVLANRKDDYYFARVGADWAARDWCTLGVFCERDQNDSGGRGSRSFSRDRVGVQMSLAF